MSRVSGLAALVSVIASIRRVLDRTFRSRCCFDAGAAILFFGALAQQPALQSDAYQAIQELAALGYRIPSAEAPLRVFPALTDAEFSGRHAGAWRPGSIYLRDRTQPDFPARAYLRHELFHEASYRSCNGRLPEWAEEMAAMRFSGELAGREQEPQPNTTELEDLISHIRQNSPLNQRDREILGRLALHYPWPAEICQVPEALSRLLGAPFTAAGSGYVLASLVSGRILETGGDIATPMPPGSLLKVPYAAALNQANPQVLADELAASDTGQLLLRRAAFRPERYRLLLSPIKQQSLTQQAPVTERDWRAYLGERRGDGSFALEASLPELVLTLRAALLSQPDYFTGLVRNGANPNSTLAGINPADKRIFRELQALAKTGTVSSSDGQPLIGHLMLAWPAEHPVYLAVFRQSGSSGAAIAAKAAGLLRDWQRRFPPRYAAVRVHLLSATDPTSWQAHSDCPELETGSARFNLCGTFYVTSTARGSRSERRVSGILHQPAADGARVLETDADSYADAVLAAEAQQLKGDAREALRAVIVWNGSRGGHRHPESRSLCDTTHCMVFLGEDVDVSGPSRRGHITDPKLLGLLDELAANRDWLPFANGGAQHWQRQIPIAELQRLFAEAHILEIRRERRKDGALYVRLVYADNDEAVSCEIFRNTLKLPSCPDSIQAADNQSWLFQGIGAGHGEGLSIETARELAEAGRSAEQILRDAYASKAPR
ncbi:hypothetical protein PL263_14945 [Methylomonas sp. EFPC3]|uniref:hypothetical protein n=1 Tax=Methylomonas sp. EFPC3 TaxID=3021710 RepID=UPI0024171E10|nr:hypothetical protein [Methylomonas sp. EFPC3]WFP49389.1 hypothetical protein PL263_14945 [Methylomonas sp. EFPC3]